MNGKNKVCISFYKITHGLEKFNLGLRQIREGMESIPGFEKESWDESLAKIEYHCDFIANKAFGRIREILSPETKNGL